MKDQNLNIIPDNSLFSHAERADFEVRERMLVHNVSSEIIPFWKSKRNLFLERAEERFGHMAVYY